MTAETTGPARPAGRVRVQTLVILRWLAVTGQALALLFVHIGLEFELPFGPALATVAASAVLNIVLSLRLPAATRLGDGRAAVLLGYDVAQLAVLLFLTGGLDNPFAILILAPVIISATVLSLRSTLALGAAAIAAVSLLAVFHLPLPWFPGGFHPPPTYIIGTWTALVISLAFTVGYAWRVAQETRRMSDALGATQSALAQERQLVALGGLAAAAAHELGTPLNTITLLAREIADGLPADSPLGPDVGLLRDQVARCREILARIGREAAGGGDAWPRVSLGDLAAAAAEPYRDRGIPIRVHVAGGPMPEVGHSPELTHGLGNLIENAVDFAASAVEIRLDGSADRIAVEILDDGPGIPFDVLASLGEPYTTTRGEGGGMGLGVFIAKTLLELTGATVRFANRPAAPGRVAGASVAISWPRGILERPGGTALP